MVTKEQKTIKLKCTREDCQYEWEYKGEGKFYATCPRCYRKLNIRKQLEKSGGELK